MYDTIDCKLQKEKVPILNKTSLLNYVPQFLERISIHQFNDGKDVSITGYIKNLKIIVTSGAVKIKDSSLCKWWLNDNIKTMFRGDTQRAFEKISDILHLPMQAADVTSIDIAGNILLKHNTSLYFDNLGQLNHFNRSTVGSGLYYKGANGILNFYDKILESKTKKIEIPSLYYGKNLLRFERRFSNRLCKQFNRAELKVSDLFDDTFYIEIIDRWANDYFRIDKIKVQKTIDYDMVKNKKDLANQALLYYIESRGGLLIVLDEVKKAQQAGKLNKHQAQDLRDKYKQVANNKLFMQESDFIIELDSKIKQIQKNYR